MTESLKVWVPAHPLNPSGFDAQKGRRETNFHAALAGVDEIQMFFVRFNDKENMLVGGVKASGSGYGPFGGKDRVCVCR